MERFGTAAILCGGKSRRMGFDKCRITIGDRTLLQLIADELTVLFDRVILIADDKRKYSDLPYQVFEDIYPGTGPVGGIYTALRSSTTEQVFVTACDMPQVNLPFIRHMMEIIKSDGVTGVVSRKGGYVEPLYAFYGKSMERTISELIGEGRFKVLDAILACSMRILEETEWQTYNGGIDLFTNLNSTDDLRILEEIFGEGATIGEEAIAKKQRASGNFPHPQRVQRPNI